MRLRLGPKHRHEIISHTRLGVGRPGKQSDWRMYWSAGGWGGRGYGDWGAEGRGVQSGVMINLASQLPRSEAEPASVCTGKRSICTVHMLVWVWASVHARECMCARTTTLTLATAWRMTCLKETNVRVAKRLPGVGRRASEVHRHRKPLSASSTRHRSKPWPRPKVVLFLLVCFLNPIWGFLIENVNPHKHKLFAYWRYPGAGHRWADSNLLYSGGASREEQPTDCTVIHLALIRQGRWGVGWQEVGREGALWDCSGLHKQQSSSSAWEDMKSVSSHSQPRPDHLHFG